MQRRDQAVPLTNCLIDEVTGQPWDPAQHYMARYTTQRVTLPTENWNEYTMTQILRKFGHEKGAVSAYHVIRRANDSPLWRLLLFSDTLGEVPMVRTKWGHQTEAIRQWIKKNQEIWDKDEIRIRLTSTPDRTVRKILGQHEQNATEH